MKRITGILAYVAAAFASAFLCAYIVILVLATQGVDVHWHWPR